MHLRLLRKLARRHARSQAQRIRRRQGMPRSLRAVDECAGKLEQQRRLARSPCSDNSQGAFGLLEYIQDGFLLRHWLLPAAPALCRAFRGMKDIGLGLKAEDQRGRMRERWFQDAGDPFAAHAAQHDVTFPGPLRRGPFRPPAIVQPDEQRYQRRGSILHEYRHAAYLHG